MTSATTTAAATPGWRARGRSPLLLLVLILFAMCIASLSLGAVRMTPLQVVAIVADAIGIALPIQWEREQASVLLAIRLPRTVLGALIGAGLATAGVALQAVFRNPLADPTLIGVSNSAALAAAAVLVLGHQWLHGFPAVVGALAVPIAAFSGGLAGAAAVQRLARVAGTTVTGTLLLAGIAINALTGAGIGLLLFAANDAQLRSVTFWNLGSLGGATWQSVASAAPFIVVGIIALPRLAGALNCLVLGEAEAGHLGIAVEQLKRRAVALAALAVGAAVAVSGTIAFVGLIVPHLVRLTLGPDHHRLIPAAALFGASLLLGADLCARTIVAPAELPIGIVTALIGAPFFLWLLRRTSPVAHLS